MDRNYQHKQIKNENRTNILRVLLPNELKLEDLEKQLLQNTPPIKRSTLFKYLDIMEKDRLIERVFQNDRRRRIYKITSKGSALLNECDTETKSKIFTAYAFSDFDNFFKRWFIFDSRISDEASVELLEILMEIDIILHTPGIPIEQLTEKDNYLKHKYETILKNENIPIIPNSEIILRKEFFDFLSLLIREFVWFTVFKFMEDKNPETLYLLKTLPELIVSRLSVNQLSPTQFKEHLIFSGLLDDYYLRSQKINHQNYKEMVEMYNKNSDTLFLKVIDLDFKKDRDKKMNSLLSDIIKNIEKKSKTR